HRPCPERRFPDAERPESAFHATTHVPKAPFTTPRNVPNAPFMTLSQHKRPLPVCRGPTSGLCRPPTPPGRPSEPLPDPRPQPERKSHPCAGPPDFQPTAGHRQFPSVVHSCRLSGAVGGGLVGAERRSSGA